MGRVLIAVLLSAFIAEALAPPTEAFPGGEVGVYVVTACIWIGITVIQSILRTEIRLPTLIALAVSAIAGNLWSSQLKEGSPLLNVSLAAVSAIAPCDAGCGFARTDLLSTLLATALVALVLVPASLALVRMRGVQDVA